MEGYSPGPHIEGNRRFWDGYADQYQAAHSDQLEEYGGAGWGVWHLPESELGVLGDVAGRDVLELGCGAGQWSIELQRRGARMTGLDLSERQLEHARRLMSVAGVEFDLVCASAERTPFADRSFDIVFCDFGAMAFADPYLTIPEAARILRPGGLLAFLMGTPILDLTWDPADEHPDDRLLLDYWRPREMPDPDGSVMFQLRYGEWIALFVDSGFAVESLIELRPPADATSSYRDEKHLRWARRWPMEHIWRVRRTGHVSGAGR